MLQLLGAEPAVSIEEVNVVMISYHFLIRSMMGLLSSFDSIVGEGKIYANRYVVSMLCIV